MKSSIRQPRKPIVLITLLLIGMGLLFQNCSDVNFVDMAAQEKADAARALAIGQDKETVTSGLNNVPDFKMVFVVDNSGTMKQNQLNLAASFTSLFDASNDASLSKFDTTAFLLSTAQRVPSYTADRGTLDAIYNKQKNFSILSPIANTLFNSSYRSSTTNFGLIPGDNIGYQVQNSLSPTKYSFLPAPVLGQKTDGNNTQLTNSIRKLASESSTQMEGDFIKRLAILNAERIPLVQSGSTYQPEFASVVDSESGLCAVARVLRNPTNFIKVGDLISFMIVSDENDNDPQGLNCVNSVTEFNGTEDLVDGLCVQKQTILSYKTNSQVKAPDSCNLNGQKQYNFRYTYANGTPTTNITFRALSAAATYRADYSNLTYKQTIANYSLLTTNISYYTQTCVPVYSDGQQISTKCTVNPGPLTGSKVGNYTADCFGLAKSLNGNAINSAGYVPVCSGPTYKASGVCSATDANCKITYSSVDRTVSNILGNLNAAACLTKAQSFGDLTSGTTPTCTYTPRLNLTSCSAAEQAAGCTMTSAATYASKAVVGVSGDVTSDGCLAWAKGQPGNGVSSVADISLCQKVAPVGTLQYNSSLTFAEVGGADGGNLLPVNGDCGSIRALALAKAQSANSQIKSTDACTITSYGAAPQSNELLTSNCATQAQNRCTTQNLRQCVGTLVVGATSGVSSSAVPFATVNEEIDCNSKCNSSKFGICGADSGSDMTILQHMQKNMGATVSCLSNTVVTPNTSEGKTSQLANNTNICAPTMTGIPKYFVRTAGPYRTKSIDVDYVAGSMKNANNQTVPKMDLVSYIEARTKELSAIDPIFSALVRRPTDPLGQGGTYGTAYEELIAETSGKVDSVLSADYSVALKDLSRVIKNRLERSFSLKKMRVDQIITHVYRVPQGTTNRILLDGSQWKQNGTTIELNPELDFVDGDGFEIVFQNNIG